MQAPPAFSQAGTGERDRHPAARGRRSSSMIDEDLKWEPQTQKGRRDRLRSGALPPDPEGPVLHSLGRLGLASARWLSPFTYSGQGASVGYRAFSLSLLRSACPVRPGALPIWGQQPCATRPSCTRRCGGSSKKEGTPEGVPSTRRARRGVTWSRHGLAYGLHAAFGKGRLMWTRSMCWASSLSSFCRSWSSRCSRTLAVQSAQSGRHGLP